MRGLAALGLVALVACGRDAPPGEPGFETPQSGSVFLQPETRALQADDFANPGFFWVDRGEAMFTEPATDGPACATCHSGDERALDGAAARYPAIDEQTGDLFNLERRINACRTRYQGESALEYESEGLLALSAYVAHLSRSQRV